MPSLQQHPDGWVIIQGADGAEYLDSLANFAADQGAALPALPAGEISRYYVPGEHHSTSDGENQKSGGELTWPEGDALIAALPQLLAAQTAREEAARQAAEAAAQAARQAAEAAAQAARQEQEQQQEQQQGQGQNQQQGEGS